MEEGRSGLVGSRPSPFESVVTVSLVKLCSSVVTHLACKNVLRVRKLILVLDVVFDCSTDEPDWTRFALIKQSTPRVYSNLPE